MIESVELAGWDGIESGAVTGLSSRTALICPEVRGRRALLAALGFLRIDELYAGFFERIWARSATTGHTTVGALVPAGRATIRARLDGRETELAIDSPKEGRLRGTLLGIRDPIFEIDLDHLAGRVVGLRGLPGGPRTIVGQLMLLEAPQPGLTGAALALAAAHTPQTIVLASEWAAFPEVTREELQRWTSIELSLTNGLLHSNVRSATSATTISTSTC